MNMFSRFRDHQELSLTASNASILPALQNTQWLDRGEGENYYRLRIHSRCKLIPISQQSPSLDSKHSCVWVG